MNKVDSKNLYTERLDLRLPSMNEQNRLWEILTDEKVNQFYFPTFNWIFTSNNLSKNNIDDLKRARTIFLKKLCDWGRQKQFYEQKVISANNQEDKNKFTWSIFLKNTDTVIGQITCQPKDDEPEDIRDCGWFIDPSYQQQGYAFEAAEAVFDFMFNDVEISEIKTSAADINRGSWRIMEKLGFVYDGEYQSTYYYGDEILMAKKYYGNKDLFLNRPKDKTKIK
jgi:RimJ/RimL family protein N-acetyltransferase